MTTTTPEDEFLAELANQIGSGLPDNFRATIKDARFDYNTPSSADVEPKLTLICDLVTDDPDLGDNGTIQDHYIGIGNGWITEDNGKTIVREDGKKGKLNDGTAAGKLGAGLMSQAAFGEALRDRYRRKIANGPLTAAFYEGVTGIWTRHEREFTGRDGKPGTMRWMECAFECYADDAKGSANGAKPTAAPTKKAAKVAKKAAAKKVDDAPADDAAETAADAPTTDATESPLIAAVLAVQADVLGENGTGDFNDFLAAAYDVPGVEDDADVVAFIDDEPRFMAAAEAAGWTV